jgi:hypothetical protein
MNKQRHNRVVACTVGKQDMGGARLSVQLSYNLVMAYSVRTHLAPPSSSPSWMAMVRRPKPGSGPVMVVAWWGRGGQ